MTKEFASEDGGVIGLDEIKSMKPLLKVPDHVYKLVVSYVGFPASVLNVSYT